MTVPAQRTYLDYNATAPLRASARVATIEALDMCGNPSSIHADGRQARSLIEAARQNVADLAGAPSDGVVFTSGGTEADAWMLGAWAGPVAISAVEHEAVRLARPDAIVLPVDARGIVEIDAVADQSSGTLLSVMSANNETGVLQPIPTVAKIARDRGLVLHCDAVQSCGRLDASPLKEGAHAITMSAHKMGGPKGVGALVVADPADLPDALIRGGGQERNHRAGTENVAAIAGFGAVANEALQLTGDWARLSLLRDWIEDRIVAISPAAVIAGREAPRLPNTSCVALPAADAQGLVIACDLAGFSVSAGSACSSGKVSASQVLAAMGWDDDLCRSAIRISLGLETTEDDAARFIAAWSEIAARHTAMAGLAA